MGICYEAGLILDDTLFEEKNWFMLFRSTEAKTLYKHQVTFIYIILQNYFWYLNVMLH